MHWLLIYATLFLNFVSIPLLSHADFVNKFLEKSIFHFTNNDLHLFFQRAERLKVSLSHRFILINCSKQKLFIFENSTLLKVYSISTAKNGVGQDENSGNTPLGLHYIRDMIGSECAENIYFKRCRPKGKFNPLIDDIYMTARIIRISGLEPYFNAGIDAFGKNVDTYSRTIYIHGTNKIAQLGKPASCGCIRLHPRDVIELFSLLKKNDLVFIY